MIKAQILHESILSASSKALEYPPYFVLGLC
jgi:hypothetical protein